MPISSSASARVFFLSAPGARTGLCADRSTPTGTPTRSARLFKMPPWSTPAWSTPVSLDAEDVGVKGLATVVDLGGDTGAVL